MKHHSTTHTKTAILLPFAARWPACLLQRAGAPHSHVAHHLHLAVCGGGRQAGLAGLPLCLLLHQTGRHAGQVRAPGRAQLVGGVGHSWLGGGGGGGRVQLVGGGGVGYSWLGGVGYSWLGGG